MTYLSHTTFKIPIKIFGIKVFSVYRQKYVLIESDTDTEAMYKMNEFVKENKNVVFFEIMKGI